MKIKRCMLLSGTPILARPNEIYNILRILRPDIFHSFKEFGMRYCNPRESNIYNMIIIYRLFWY
jgi:SWI/SNF-related matrix-associated actin-dependent regulator 1 of chromatin subfamily A